MKKITKFMVIIFLIIFFLWIVFEKIKIQDIILRKIYPLNYVEDVEKFSKNNNIDPLLVYAIIKAESNFEANITSHSGACGLMQIMEETAKEIAKKINYNYTSKEDLYNPHVNIMLGTKYFAYLLEKYGNTELALTAYNAGIGNVQKWIENGTIKKDGSDIQNIPFKETNNYVRKILRDYKIYKSLYRKEV